MVIGDITNGYEDITKSYNEREWKVIMNENEKNGL